MRYEQGMSSAIEGSPRGRGAQRLWLLALVLLALVAAACDSTTSGSEPSGGGKGGSADPAAPKSAAHLTITPSHDSSDVDPSAGISVSVSDGTLTDVTAEPAHGDAIEGAESHGGTAWRSTWALETDTHYVVHATATDADGVSVTKRSSFTTLAPQRTFSTTIFEGAGQSYGVGMPIILNFSSPIQNKRAIERSLQVWTSNRVVGAWYWDGDKTLYFRPRDYWPEHTQVRFVGHLDGIDAGRGVYGVHTPCPPSMPSRWPTNRTCVCSGQ